MLVPSLSRKTSAHAADENVRTIETAMRSLSIWVFPRARSQLQGAGLGEFGRGSLRLGRRGVSVGFEREAVRGAEVVAPRGVYDLCREFDCVTLEEADVGDAVEQVARLARLHLPARDRVVVQDVVERELIAADAARVRRALENLAVGGRRRDRKSTRLNSSHANISYAVFC